MSRPPVTTAVDAVAADLESRIVAGEHRQTGDGDAGGQRPPPGRSPAVQRPAEDPGDDRGGSERDDRADGDAGRPHREEETRLVARDPGGPPTDRPRAGHPQARTATGSACRPQRDGEQPEGADEHAGRADGDR